MARARISRLRSIFKSRIRQSQTCPRIFSRLVLTAHCPQVIACLLTPVSYCSTSRPSLCLQAWMDNLIYLEMAAREVISMDRSSSSSVTPAATPQSRMVKPATFWVSFQAQSPSTKG